MQCKLPTNSKFQVQNYWKSASILSTGPQQHNKAVHDWFQLGVTSALTIVGLKDSRISRTVKGDVKHWMIHISPLGPNYEVQTAQAVYLHRQVEL